MKRCGKYEQLMDKALNDELNKTEAEVFYNQLESCAGCAGEFRALKETLTLFRSANKPEPDAAFMDNFWEMLQPKLIEENIQKKSMLSKLGSLLAGCWRNLKSTFNTRLSLKHQLAGGFILLLVGVLIGRFVITEDKNMQPEIKLNKDKNIRVVDQSYRDAEDYMQRSKILMLSMMNYDASDGEISTIGLVEQQKISKDLLKKAVVLKEQLKDAQLRNLVSDIEVILLQIANLEVEYDLSGIELIQEGVDSKGLILKINIQEMNIENEETDENRTTQTNGNSI